MFRVCTYPDPFTIKSNKELWNIITINPQFCASQTLVQGLGRYYGKKSFYFIQTAQTLIDNLYGDWTRSFDSDINVYLAVSNYIKNVKNETLKSSLKNNISDIVKSIKLLIIMRADRSMFDENTLSFEQKEVLKIYENICETTIGKYFDKYDSITKDDFKTVLKKCLIDDINNYIEREEIVSCDKAKTMNEARDNLEKIKRAFKEKLNERNFFAALDDNSNYPEKIDEVNHYLELTNKDINMDTIVFHGVHKISPIMYFLFKSLDRLGINVVFVINYMKNYPEICKTWDKVYAWTKCKFEFVEDLISQYNDLGKSFGELFEKDFVCPNLQNINIDKFANLTQFTDEISNVYSNAKAESKKKSSVLSNMKIQYYAVDSEGSNKILKIYYPEQFGSKHFLTYPIGQFILNIYNMWDNKKRQLLFKFSNLYECINSGLMLKNNTSKLFNICKKIELYFGEEFNLSDVIKKANSLKVNLNKVNTNKNLDMLKKISFYSITNEDIDLFVDYIEKLNNIALMLFNEESVNYKNHFKRLIDIVSTMVNDDSNVSKIELDLVNEIKNRLQTETTDEIEGSIEDIQQAIFYYLSAVQESDSSNWIVRGFDQIDGGVLLSKSSKSKAYHFALLSNNHLCGIKLQELPYPLTTIMFKNYEDSDSCINVVNACYQEQRNYLRFYLFYALIFTQKNIELSYIETEKEGEIQDVYYAFKALGLNISDKNDETIPKLAMEKVDMNSGIEFSLNSVGYKDKEIFSICPYKFFLTAVLKDNIIYSSDYHVKYFVNNFLEIYLAEKYQNCDYDSVSKEIDKDLISFKELFPFWLDSEYLDIIRKLKTDFIKYMVNPDNHKIISANERYIERKENFLIAQWREQNRKGEVQSEKMMIFPKERGFKNIDEELIEYMNNSSTHNFERRKQFPHNKVCENCNYKEVCLRNYYEVLENEYNDIGDSGDEK